MSLRRITYVSRPTPELGPAEFRQLLGLAEVLHRRHDLSGVLAYTGRHFIQVIEGSTTEVEDLMTLIKADKRHSGIRVLCDEIVSCRLFDHWDYLLVDSLDLIDEIAGAHVEAGAACDRARLLTERLIERLGQTSY